MKARSGRSTGQVGMGRANRTAERAINLTASILGILNFFLAATALIPSLQVTLPPLQAHNLVLRFLTFSVVTVLLAKGAAFMMLRLWKEGGMWQWVSVLAACVHSWVRLFNIQWFLLGPAHLSWSSHAFWRAVGYVILLLVLVAIAHIPSLFFVGKGFDRGDFSFDDMKTLMKIDACVQLVIAALVVIGGST